MFKHFFNSEKTKRETEGNEKQSHYDNILLKLQGLQFQLNQLKHYRYIHIRPYQVPLIPLTNKMINSCESLLIQKEYLKKTDETRAQSLVDQQINALSDFITKQINSNLSKLQPFIDEINDEEQKERINRYIEQQQKENDAQALVKLSALLILLNDDLHLQLRPSHPEKIYASIKKGYSPLLLSLPTSVKANLREQAYSVYQKHISWINALQIQLSMIVSFLGLSMIVFLPFSTLGIYNENSAKVLDMILLITMAIALSSLALAAISVVPLLVTFMLFQSKKEGEISVNDPLLYNHESDFSVWSWKDNDGEDIPRASYQLNEKAPLQALPEENNEIKANFDEIQLMIDGIDQCHHYGQHKEESASKSVSSTSSCKY